MTDLVVYLPLPSRHRLEAGTPADVVHQDSTVRLFVVCPRDRPEPILHGMTGDGAVLKFDGAGVGVSFDGFML